MIVPAPDFPPRQDFEGPALSAPEVDGGLLMTVITVLQAETELTPQVIQRMPEHQILAQSQAGNASLQARRTVEAEEDQGNVLEIRPARVADPYPVGPEESRAEEAGDGAQGKNEQEASQRTKGSAGPWSAVTRWNHG